MTLFNRLILTGLCLSAPMALLAKPYKGGEVYSQQSYLYGKFEMQMQAAPGSAVLSTFFTYKNGSEVGNTFWEEIDIEIFGRGEGREWQSNIILGSSRPTIHSDAVHEEDFSLTNSYNRYRLEWTPDYVAWFVNDVEVRRIIGTSTVTSLTSPQSLRFNLWASDAPGWVGAWDDKILPTHQFIDYFSYAPYNSATKTFDESAGWRDDFNAFDTSRWGKADWTFDGNRVDFSPANVTVRNGVLILSLTHENQEGFTGVPPAPPALPVSSSSASSEQAVSSSSLSSSVPSQSSSAQSSEASSSVAVASSSLAVTSSSAASSSPTIKIDVKKSGGAFAWFGLIFLLAAALVKRKPY